MEFALLVRMLLRRKLLLAVGLLIAAIAAVFSVYRLDGTRLKARSLQYSGASTQLLIDSPKSVLGNLDQSFEPLSTRALVYANFMASPSVLDLIGQRVGLSGSQIYAAGPVNAQGTRVEQEPTALKRNVEIAGETDPYRLNFASQANLPTISIYAQAPTTGQAVALANASVVALQEYVTHLQKSTRTPPAARVTVRQLGPASGSVVNGGIRKSLAALVFVLVFVLWCALLLVAERVRANWRSSAALLEAQGDRRDGDADNEDGLREASNGDGAPALGAERVASPAVARDDDWARISSGSAS